MRKTALALAVCLLVGLLAVPASADDDHKYRVRRLDMVFSSTTVRVNQERTLYVEITPAYAEDKTIYWTSSNPEVAIVEADGTVYGISPGTTVITATSATGKTAACTVTVPGSVLTGIEQDVGNETLASIAGGEMLYAYRLRADVQGAMHGMDSGGQALVTYTDKTTVSMTALRAAAFTAAYMGGTVRLRFQTTGSDGVQGQMTVYPANASEDDISVNVAVYTESAQARQVASTAAASFGGAAVVELPHGGSFGMNVEVAAKADLSGLDTAALRLYRYSAETGTCTPLDNQGCRVDEDGYIHFTTNTGGFIVIA